MLFLSGNSYIENLSDCFFTQQGQGIGKTGQYFTVSDAHAHKQAQEHGWPLWGGM